ncbi:MAG: DUF3459 domain-containing protein, partial [Actinomycetota bacterium]|nr:DUF3459 domain-containing protein [Actinomycetota bacterium]
LSDGRMDLVTVESSEEPAWLVMHRRETRQQGGGLADDRGVWVACNFSSTEVDVPMPHRDADLALSSSKDPSPHGSHRISVAPESVALFTRL